MPELSLYYFPVACSHVTVCALEEAGLPYDLKLVNLAKGEQGSEEYRKVNPLGKVPAMLIDGELLTENVAIISYIDALKPEAKLLGADNSPRGRADAIAGLSFCSATLHPQVRGILNPQRLTEGEKEPVRAMSIKLATKSYAFAEARIAERGWWLGDCSIIDAYLQWTLSIATLGGMDTSPFPHLADHLDRLNQRPSIQRARSVADKARKALGLS